MAAILTARYPSRCPTCGTRINVGDLVKKNRKKWHHKACINADDWTPPPPPPPGVDLAARAEARYAAKQLLAPWREGAR